MPSEPRGATIAVEERRRVELFQRLSSTLGEEAANTLSDLLPPRGDELATSSEVRGLDVRVAHLDERLSTSMHELDQRLTSRMDSLEERLTSQMRESEARLSAQIDRRVSDAITTQTRTIVLSQLAALVAIAALAFGLQ